MTGASDNVWVEAEAQRLAPLLGGEFAVVLCGPDAHAAAAVALKIAHIHGANRRVAIADLIGDDPALCNAVQPGADDDPHGISDSFLYGVSLNRIARPIDPAGNIFLMPSGTESVALEAVYRNERWRKLSAGFEQVGALLLIVAVRDVPGFDALCQYVGAMMPVGEQHPSATAGVRMLWIAPPPPPVERVRQVERAREVATEDRGKRQSRMLASLAGAAALLLAGLAAWPSLSARFFPPDALTTADIDRESADTLGADSTRNADSLPMISGGTVVVETTVGEAAGAGNPDSSVSSPEAAEIAVPRVRSGPLVIGNPEDANRAAAFAVYFVSANTVEEARPPAEVEALSGVAVSPVRIGAEASRWYRVTVGAGTDSAQALAMLQRLRDAEQIGAASGSIIRVPFAFKLEDGLTPDNTSAALARWTSRGIRAYALRQTSGAVTLYTGAFQNPAQATWLADSLYGAGIAPTLVYRTGRTF